MPIYEYACRRCGKGFETLLIRSGDAEEVACPGCGARDVTRQLSRTASPRREGADVGAAPPACGPVG